MAELSIDAGVMQALMSLMAVTKPIHDHYFAFAIAADTKEMDRLVKYIRKRSHAKGDLWKSVLFFANDFVTINEIPATSSCPVDPDMDVPEILDGMLASEIACRQAIEKVMGEAYAVNEQRVVLFLKDFVKEYAHAERKIDRMRTLWGELNGDIYEFERMM